MLRPLVRMMYIVCKYVTGIWVGADIYGSVCFRPTGAVGPHCPSRPKAEVMARRLLTISMAHPRPLLPISVICGASRQDKTMKKFNLRPRGGDFFLTTTPLSSEVMIRRRETARAAVSRAAWRYLPEFRVKVISRILGNLLYTVLHTQKLVYFIQ